MTEYYMDCRKCKQTFNEKDLESSHDVPFYLGGTDKDGRHWLCKKCHKKYEHYNFTKISHYLKSINEEIREKLREISKDSAMRFFKK